MTLSEGMEGAMAEVGEEQAEKSQEELRDRPGRFASLGWRILLWTSLVAFLPLFIMASQGYHCARQAVYQSQESRLRDVLDSKRSQFEAWLGEIETDLSLLASTPGLLPGGVQSDSEQPTGQTAPGQQLLAYVKRGNSAYEAIEILNMDLDRISVEPPDAGKSHAELTGDFKAKLASAPGFIMAPTTPMRDDGVHLHAAFPIYLANGQKGGYVVAHVEISRAFDPVFHAPPGPGQAGHVYMLSTTGKYLYPREAAQESRAVYAPPAIRSGDASRIHEYPDDHGEQVIGASSGIPDLGWVVVAEFDWKEAFGWLGILKRRALVTGSITLVLVLLIAARGARILSGPLRELASVARRIAAGHHEERLGRLKGAEAQELSNAFNSMLDKLAASHRRLMHAASLAAVGELSSSTVHEMRNPLSSVKINLQALSKKVESSPAHQELAAIALEQLARVEKMLSELLQYGRPLELNLTRIRFDEVVRGVLPVVGNKAQTKDVSLEVDDQLGGADFVADGEQIRRALTNLVANAIEASPADATVAIKTTLAEKVSNHLAILVTDEGPGIPDAQMDKLFKPFFTTRQQGTGLGLANVKKIVEYHGGSVTAKNRPEGGAVFTILLPLGGPPA